jgi:hypothetical protein
MESQTRENTSIFNKKIDTLMKKHYGNNNIFRSCPEKNRQDRKRREEKNGENQL